MTLAVVRGRPTEEELAAIVVVLTAGAGARPAAAPPRTGWSAYSRTLRAPGHRGPEAWRLSAR